MTPLCGLASLQAGAQTFSDELARVLEEHPRVRAAAQSLKAARERVDEAEGAFLPTVEVTGDQGYEYVDSPERRSTAGEPSSLPRTRGSLTVTQNVFTGFRNSANLDIAHLDASRAELELERTRQNVTFEAVLAHNDVVRDTRLVQLSNLSEQTIARQLNLEDERVERGSGIAVDVLLAKTRLQLAKERRVTFEGDLVQSMARYEQVFGNPPLAVDLEPVGIRPGDLPQTLEDARLIAKDSNFDLTVAGMRVNTADARTEVAESALYPQVDLVGSANYEDNVNANRGIRRDFSVLLRMNWELFSGFRTQSAAAAAAHDKSAAIETEADSRRQTNESVALAWQALKTAQERAELLDNAAVIAREVFDARQRLREAGKETALAVLDAETEVFNARINFIRATFDAHRERARLLRAIGQLTSDKLGAPDARP